MGGVSSKGFLPSACEWNLLGTGWSLGSWQVDSQVIPAGFFPRPRRLTRLPVSAIKKPTSVFPSHTDAPTCQRGLPNANTATKLKETNTAPFRRSDLFCVSKCFYFFHSWLMQANPDSPPTLPLRMLFTLWIPRLPAYYNMPFLGEEELDTHHTLTHSHTHTQTHIFTSCFIEMA